MRGLVGLLWALGGAVAGFIAGVIVALVIAKVTDASNREGAQGYFAFALGVIGAVVGIIAGLTLYGRSAPAGQGASYAGSGVLGILGVVAAIAIGIFVVLKTQEKPLMYGGAQANIDMELRFRTTDFPADAREKRWLNVEVHTAKTRPVGTLLWDEKRIEGEYTILRVTQGAFYRASGRVIVVSMEGKQTEAFSPPIKRTPDPKADWSKWYRPSAVDPPYGVEPKEPLKSIVELRYKVSVWGQ